MVSIYSAVNFRLVDWFVSPSVVNDGQRTVVSVPTMLKWCVTGELCCLVFALAYRYVHRAFFGLPEVNGNTSNLVLDSLMLGESRWAGLGWACVCIWLVGICTPIIEEILFRGLLLRLIDQHSRHLTAIVVTGCLFGIMHGPHQFFPKSLAGFFYGWMTIRFQSLIPAIIAHALNNCATALGLLTAISFGYMNPVLQEIDEQRLADLANDTKRLSLAKRTPPQFSREYAASRRKAYETPVRHLLQTWEHTDTTIDQILDTWEQFQIKWWDIKSQLDLEAPAEVGDRRNAWKVRRWTKRREELLADVDRRRDNTLLDILKDKQRLGQLKQAFYIKNEGVEKAVGAPENPRIHTRTR
jgi:hypothetical protein